MELEKACPMIEQRMLNPATNQHQNYLIHRAWNQSDLQAMKMQMKDYDDNPEGFVEQILYYINLNKANHKDVIRLMTTVLPVKIWRETKELATWPDVAPEGEIERRKDHFSSMISDSLENPLYLFADDSTLCRTIGHPSDRQAAASSLTAHLDKITIWSNTWNMSFNPDKSHTLPMSLRKHHLEPPPPPPHPLSQQSHGRCPFFQASGSLYLP